jgi:hypothetical protein
MKLKKFNKKERNRFSFFKNIIGFPAYLITSIAAILQVILFFSPNYEVTVAMAKSTMSKNESYLKDGNIDALLDSFHDDFRMAIVHATGRKETLNKSQYRKQYEMISAFGLSHSQNYEIVKMKLLENNRLEVTLIMNQSFKSERHSFLDHENVNFQIMELVNDNGVAKIIRVTSNIRNLVSSEHNDGNKQLLARL